MVRKKYPLPVVGVVSEYLELGVGDVPIFVGGALFEYHLVFDYIIDLVFAKEGEDLGKHTSC